MADGMNSQISEALVERHIHALRVEASLRQGVLAQLAMLERELVDTLKREDPTDRPLLAQRRRDIQRLMTEELDPLIQARYAHIAAFLDAALLRLATQETEAVQTIVNNTTDTDTVAALPSARRLRAGVVAGLFPSAATPTDLSTVGADWWMRASESLSRRVGDSLTTGIALEESLTQLTQRVRGTSANGFADGLMAKARRDADMLLRTHVTNTLAEARVAVADTNPGSVAAIEHVSILDSHTTQICLARDGLRYTVPGHDPIGHNVSYLSGIPYHIGCRSSFVPVVQGGGAVARQSVAQWLQRRDTAYQDEVLGPTRARMFREGRLTPRQLIDSLSGRPLRLDEL